MAGLLFEAYFLCVADVSGFGANNVVPAGDCLQIKLGSACWNIALHKRCDFVAEHVE